MTTDHPERDTPSQATRDLIAKFQELHWRISERAAQPLPTLADREVPPCDSVLRLNGVSDSSDSYLSPPSPSDGSSHQGTRSTPETPAPPHLPWWLRRLLNL